MLQYLPKNSDDDFELPEATRAPIKPSPKDRGAQRLLPTTAESAHSYWARVKDELAERWSRSGESDHPTSSGRNCVGDGLSGIVESLQPLTRATGRKVELELHHRHAECAFGDDLRQAILALLEAAMSARSGPIRVVSQLYEDGHGGQFAIIEVFDDSLDVPDAVRRKLSKAAIARAGQTSFISALSGSCVRIRLPMTGAVAVDATAVNSGPKDIAETRSGEVDFVAAAADSSVLTEPTNIADIEQNETQTNASEYPNSDFKTELSWTTCERTEYVPRY